MRSVCVIMLGLVAIAALGCGTFLMVHQQGVDNLFWPEIVAIACAIGIRRVSEDEWRSRRTAEIEQRKKEQA